METTLAVLAALAGGVNVALTAISAAMTLRRVKSGLSKMVRKRRSVSRCCTSISSMVGAAICGSRAVRQSSWN